LHPTTTLRHYVHTLCLSQWAYSLAMGKVLRVDTMFEQRVGPRTTIRRTWEGIKRDYPEEGTEILRQQRLLEHIESILVPAGATTDMSGRLAIDNTPLSAAAHDETGSNDDVESLIAEADESGLCFHFLTIEGWDRELREQPTIPPSLAGLCGALSRLATIPTGKRGSHVPRHPLQTQGNGVSLPAPLIPGDGVRNAERVLRWLVRLHSQHPAEFFFLIDLWVQHSGAREGAMNLGSQAERFLNLPVDDGVVVKKHLAKSVPPRGIIVLTGKDGAGVSRRSAAAVRWAMTWVSVQVMALQSTNSHGDEFDQGTVDA
ncbi:MAG: hypothetical protein ABF296_09170, partial [Oceanococcaceae bacterium]